MTRPEAVEEVVRRERPALIVNAAAYTAVDAAERETERAEAVNSAGAAHVAEAAKLAGARLIHVSTDYVFDGAQGRPYAPADRPRSPRRLRPDQARGRARGDRASPAARR